MNTNTAKLSLIAVVAHIVCFAVVLSHIHAKDAVSLLNQPGLNKMASTDITAKALGDLHHHIDKASLKNIQADTSTTAARVRELRPLNETRLDDTLLARFQDFLLRLRIVASLCLRVA